MRASCLVLGFGLWMLTAFGLSAQVLQNMVRNPSFEAYKQPPRDLGQLNYVTYWSSPTLATPDFFHRRALGPNVDAPENKMGITKARTGYGYAGFYAYTNRYVKRDFREYVQVELKQPMLAGEQYCIQAYIYLAHSSNRAIGALGVAGRPYLVEQSHEHFLDFNYEYLLQEDKSYLDDRVWTPIQATYTAVGGERYIIIGNFLIDKKTKVTGAVAIDSFENPHVDFAYYFLDDICVTSLRTNYNCECGSFAYATTARRERIVLDMTLDRKTYDLNQDVILQKVDFEKDRAILLAEAYDALDHLAAVLEINKTYEIEISGHTDDKGSPQINHQLSERRARAVYDYLIASGISANRMAYRGYGQARPIVLNNSKEERAINERVQFKIVKK